MTLKDLFATSKPVAATESASVATQPIPSIDEMRERLGVDIAHFGGHLPERVAIAWRGYFAALLEWSLLSVSDHDRLWALLPAIEDDPVNYIMCPRD